MRFWLVLLLLPLAGCLGTPEEEAPEPEIWGVCPQWIHDGSIWIDRINGTAETTLDGNVTAHDGHALDLYVVRAEGTGILRFFAGDRQLQVHDGSGTFRPALDLDGMAQVQLFLTAVDHDAPAAPSPLTIRVEGTGTVELEVEPWFRVCGN